jgi:hypothetical protein
MTRYYCKGAFSGPLLDKLESLDAVAGAVDHGDVVLVDVEAAAAEEVYDLLVNAGIEIQVVEDI